MKKLLLASAATALMAGSAWAEDVKLGILLGFTGPIESLTGHMANAAEAAVAEVNASGKSMFTFSTVRGDSTCTGADAAVAAATKMVTSDGVKGIIGGDCSGVTGAVLQNVARPNGIPMISPSATSPALSTAEDDGLFFRTAPSDAREGEVAADILKEHGVKSIALTYSNSDYGKGLAEAIKSSWEKLGGTTTINIPHEDGKSDYSAEVASLAAAGGDILVVAGYVDQGGSGIIQAALDTGAFSTFEIPGGMVSDTLTAKFGTQIDGSYGQVPQSDSAGAPILVDMGKANNPAYDATSPYTPESYDAAALFMLAMNAAKSSDPKVYVPFIMQIANGPADGSGEKILPGQLGHALDLIAQGKAIDYDGASGVTLIGPGESAGRYREFKIEGGQFVTVKYR